MQSTANPYVSDAESLATSAQGEIQRLRFVFERMLGLTNWYRVDNNIDFTVGSGIDGSGLGRHVTAVGLHTWSGSIQWPAITSVANHTTGFFWSGAHHLTLAFDATSDSGRFGSGQTNARSWLAFHATGITLHHTVALRFTHSLSNSSSYTHVTVLRMTSGSTQAPNNSGFSDGNDRIILGHEGATLNVIGYGASHIALGSRGYVALGRHVTGATGLGTPVKNAIYADIIPKAFAMYDANLADPVVVKFNVKGVGQESPGRYIVTWEQPMQANYVVIATGVQVPVPAPGQTVSTIATVESMSAAHVNIRLWSAIGTPGTPFDGSFNVMVIGSQ